MSDVKKASTALLSWEVTKPHTNNKPDRPMPRIVFAFPVLERHLNAADRTPQVYRPVACGHCGCSGVWCHGRYHRKADRSAAGDLNPVPVLRFRCRACSRTCSRLPLCIAPHRWYNWALQQQVLLLLFAGCSQRPVPARSSRLVGIRYGAGGNASANAVSPSNSICVAVSANSGAQSRLLNSGCAVCSACRCVRRWPGSMATVFASRDQRLLNGCATA
ncbi:hypothetical protein B0G83_1503 [Paraburkholderia sp. BL21I4N1]|nr:hypothetical protein B0G83_1503 [Paraburkholderia sp. BL21I4N1]